MTEEAELSAIDDGTEKHVEGNLSCPSVITIADLVRYGFRKSDLDDFPNQWSYGNCEGAVCYVTVDGSGHVSKIEMNWDGGNGFTDEFPLLSKEQLWWLGRACEQDAADTKWRAAAWEKELFELGFKVWGENSHRSGDKCLIFTREDGRHVFCHMKRGQVDSVSSEGHDKNRSGVSFPRMSAEQIAQLIGKSLR